MKRTIFYSAALVFSVATTQLCANTQNAAIQPAFAASIVGEAEADLAEQPAASDNQPAAPAAVELPQVSSGIAAVDTVCSKSFKGLAALYAGNDEEFAKVNLGLNEIKICMKLLLSQNVKDINELTTGGYALGSSMGYAISAGEYQQFMSTQPEIAPALVNIFAQEQMIIKTYYLAEANERLSYIMDSIEELSAMDPANMTMEEQMNMMTLQLSLETQQEKVKTFQVRSEKLGSLANLTELFSGLMYIDSMMQAPAR